MAPAPGGSFSRTGATARGAYQRLGPDDPDGGSSDTSASSASSRRSSGSRTPLKKGSFHRRLHRHRATAASAFYTTPPRQITPAESARVLRLVDRTLLPLMLSVYFLQALDKATISYAGLFGIIEDAHLRGDEFSWLMSVVYVAQLAAQMPVALALVKLPVSRLTGTLVFLWGLTLAAMAGAHSFRGLLVARFLLGGLEAGIAPAFVAVTSMWWRRGEQTLRTSLWYAMGGMATALGSPMVYALGHVRVSEGVKPYQIMFAVFGIVTMFVSLVTFRYMPDSPQEAAFLTEEDRMIAVQRLRTGRAGHATRRWSHSQFLEAVWDIKTWFWAAMIFCISIPSGGFSIFGPLIVKTFAHDSFRSLLLNVPVGAAQVVSVLGGSWLATRTRMKGPAIAFLCLLSALGTGVLLCYPHVEENRLILLLGYSAASACTGITPLIYSWSAQNTAGDTKQKTMSAFVLIGSCAGNTVGPLLFTPEEAPTYGRGLRAILAFFFAVAALVGLATLWLAEQNRRHARRRMAVGKRALLIDTSLMSAEEEERARVDKKSDDDGGGAAADCAAGDEGGAKEDLTDLQDEDFVYVF